MIDRKLPACRAWLVCDEIRAGWVALFCYPNVVLHSADQLGGAGRFGDGLMLLGVFRGTC